MTDYSYKKQNAVMCHIYKRQRMFMNLLVPNTINTASYKYHYISIYSVLQNYEWIRPDKWEQTH